MWDYEIAKGAKVWRQIGAVRVLRRTEEATRWTGYFAFGPHGESPIAAFTTCAWPGAFSPGGHVGGNFALVQGAGAPIKTVTDWLAAVKELACSAH